MWQLLPPDAERQSIELVVNQYGINNGSSSSRLCVLLLQVSTRFLQQQHSLAMQQSGRAATLRPPPASSPAPLARHLVRALAIQRHGAKHWQGPSSLERLTSMSIQVSGCEVSQYHIDCRLAAVCG
jgi:hypothetical protein